MRQPRSARLAGPLPPSGLGSNPLVLGAASAVLTAAAGVPLRAILLRAGHLDIPNHRSSHRQPVVRCGGLAPLAGTAVTAALTRRTPSAAGVVLVLAAAGLADDVTGHVPAPARLACQVVAGSELAHSKAAAPFAGLVTAGVVNVTNFMDGINGISAITGLVWGVSAIAQAESARDPLTSLGALLAGGSVGFLPHNVPTARMFLGDIGSYALGAAMTAGILSRTTLLGQLRVAAPLALYGVDAAQALVHRARSGQPIGVAHRDHIYQRLVDAGYPHLAVSCLHGLGALALAYAARQAPARGLAVAGCVIGVYLLAPRTLTGPCNAPAGAG